MLDDLLTVGHRVMIGHRSTAGLTDFLDDAISSRGVGPFALGTAAQVIDHDLGAMTGEQQCVGTAKAATSTGHDDHLVFEANGVTHGNSSSGLLLDALQSLWRVSATPQPATIKRP